MLRVAIDVSICPQLVNLPAVAPRALPQLGIRPPLQLGRAKVLSGLWFDVCFHLSLRQPPQPFPHTMEGAVGQ
eukprot:718147-Prymnesium_polylepis.1